MVKQDWSVAQFTILCKTFTLGFYIHLINFRGPAFFRLTKMFVNHIRICVSFYVFIFSKLFKLSHFNKNLQHLIYYVLQKRNTFTANHFIHTLYINCNFINGPSLICMCRRQITSHYDIKRVDYNWIMRCFATFSKKNEFLTCNGFSFKNILTFEPEKRERMLPNSAILSFNYRIADN